MTPADEFAADMFGDQRSDCERADHEAQLEHAATEIAQLHRALSDAEAERDAYRAALCDIVAARKAWRDALDCGMGDAFEAFTRLTAALDGGRVAVETGAIAEAYAIDAEDDPFGKEGAGL